MAQVDDAVEQERMGPAEVVEEQQADAQAHRDEHYQSVPRFFRRHINGLNQIDMNLQVKEHPSSANVLSFSYIVPEYATNIFIKFEEREDEKSYRRYVLSSYPHEFYGITQGMHSPALAELCRAPAKTFL